MKAFLFEGIITKILYVLEEQIISCGFSLIPVSDKKVHMIVLSEVKRLVTGGYYKSIVLVSSTMVTYLYTCCII